MSKQLQTQIHLFDNPDVNETASYVVNSVNRGKEHMQQAKQELELAVVEHWKRGKKVDEAYDSIIDECGSQRAFAKEIGVSESMLSNDLRGYRATKELGCESEGDFLDLLNQKGLKPNTYNWERLPKRLNEPDENTSQKDQRPKDEKRLEEIYRELEEIRERNESENQNHIKSKAVEIEDRVQDLSKHINKLNPADYIWESKYYREWCKSLGIDMIDRQAASDLEFHHTDIYNAVGGVGQKLPDVMGIPIRADRHRRVEGGSEDLDPIEIADGMITCLSLFIIHHFEK